VENKTSTIGKRSGVVAAIAATFAIGAQLASAQSPLSGDAAMAAIAGNTLENEFKVLFFDKNGSAKLKDLQIDRTASFRWTFTGGKLCSVPESTDRRSDCARLTVAGDKATLSGDDGAETYAILPGNARDL